MHPSGEPIEVCASDDVDTLEERLAEYENDETPRRRADAHKISTLEHGLEQIIAWSEAYPLDIFPEPDYAKAAELLKAGGMTLDAISASNMRHVITRIGEMASAALQKEDS